MSSKVLPVRQADSVKMLLRANIAKLKEQANFAAARYAHFPDHDEHRVDAISAGAQVLALDDLLAIIEVSLDRD